MELCEARDRPVNLEELSRRFRVPTDLLAQYFTDVPPIPSSSEYRDADGVRIRYFGHACLLIETSNFSILIDPTCAWTASLGGQHFSYFDFPTKIDLLILSHGHQDHLCPEVLMQLRHRVGTVPYSIE